MDWEAAATTLVGSGIGTGLIGLVSFRWLKARATTYLDAIVVEGIKARYVRESDEFKNDLSAQLELRKFELPAYKELWAGLVDLKIAGDALWEKVSVPGLTVFREKLGAAEKLVHERAPFLQKEDYQELAKLIEHFQNFGLGKEGLARLRDYGPGSEADPDDYFSEVRRIVRENGERRRLYNDLLVRMQDKTRDHLNRGPSRTSAEQ